jgi:hypothetical protein
MIAGKPGTVCFDPRTELANLLLRRACTEDLDALAATADRSLTEITVLRFWVMPRNLQQLRIFLASPSDVQPERLRVEKVVREMNLTLSNQGLQLELLRWETHTFPDFGEYPQTVIQDQIGSDYDIFVGVLWSRIGTPTPRYPSGTLEEFDTAYQNGKQRRTMSR